MEENGIGIYHARKCAEELLKEVQERGAKLLELLTVLEQKSPKNVSNGLEKKRKEDAVREFIGELPKNVLYDPVKLQTWEKDTGISRTELIKLKEGYYAAGSVVPPIPPGLFE